MNSNVNEIKISLEDFNYTNELFGNLDKNFKIIEENFNVNIFQRENKIIIKGNEEKIYLAEKVINELIDILDSKELIDVQKINYVISLVKSGKSYKESTLNKDIVCVTYKGKQIRPKTIGQKEYASYLKNNDIVFGIGPAGTGKTYLAMAMAVNSFKNKEVNRIILTRPAVEAGESLGFLPGDLQDKVDPYLRPLYDALYEILGRDSVIKYREREMIEIVPLAYMRGRTLDNSFIILDEAQNTTREQMKMFLTRLGFGSKAVITGDITQIDLQKGKQSGLKEAIKVLSNIKGIAFSYLNENDVIRHHLVQKIIRAYEKYDNNDKNKK